MGDVTHTDEMKMVNNLFAITLMLVAVCCLADEPASNVDAPVAVTSLEQAELLPQSVARVSLNYDHQVRVAKTFERILAALSEQPQIRHLTLRIPNSSTFKDESLDVLQEFESLESLELLDSRGFASPSVFGQVAAIKNLKHLEISFL